jgi:hypothetical protein
MNKCSGRLQVANWKCGLQPTLSVLGTALSAIGQAVLAVPQPKRANVMSRLDLKEIAPGRNTADTLCGGERLYLQGEHTAC